MRMTDDRLLVRVRLLPPVTAGPILGVGGGSGQLANDADVLEVGPGAMNKKTGRRVPMDVAPGDHVMLQRGGPGAPIKGECVDERERLYVVRQADVLAVLEEAVA